MDKALCDTGDRVRVQLRLHDSELQPMVTDEQSVFIRAAEGAPRRRVLRTVPGEPGLYQGSFTMNETGAFSFLVFANDNPDDTVLGREDVLVRIPDQELADSSQDAEALQRISSGSRGADASGRYVFLGKATDLAADFADRKAYTTREDTRTRAIWDNAWSLFLVLSVLGLEWLLRKRARLI